MKSLFLVLAIGASAAEAPQISADLRARFWRAQAEAIAASQQLQRANEQLAAIHGELVKTCGGEPVQDKSGEPACPPTKESSDAHRK